MNSNINRDIKKLYFFLFFKYLVKNLKKSKLKYSSNDPKQYALYKKWRKTKGPIKIHIFLSKFQFEKNKVKKKK